MTDLQWIGLAMIPGGLLWTWLAFKFKTESKPWGHFRLVAIGLTIVVAGIGLLIGQ
ncbi:hypothetical protein [Chitinophaga filiformis]|uniref:Uncharacterized protein n=1 Tax=Chitinophaga filiformis TaxID=104663 RepID=A0ABY4HTQ7_CHIFI|nr:hypothetical protein [Chitinophaga filiformis]UPK67174.1 hypothetical protein MYF79_19735 [Chitinophaga filiformis]